MRKKLATLLLLLSSISMAIGQDLIIRKNGQEIKAKVQMVTDSEVEYVNSDNTTGKIAKAEILLIMYANGTKDIFTDTKTPETQSSTSNVTTTDPVVRPTQGYTAYDFFDRKTPLIFLGIDFSYCKLTGDDFENPKQLFQELNDMLEKEKLKYDFDGAIRRFSMPYSFSYIEKRNQEIDEKTLTQNASNGVFVNAQSIIDKYDFGGTDITDGLAMILICEELNARRKEASYSYVVFDIKSKKVEISDHLIGKAGGASQRNYWARTIYEVMVEVKDKKYGQWKKAYRQ